MYNFKELDDYFSEHFDFFNTDCISVMISHGGKILYDRTKVVSDKEEYKNYNSYTNFNIGEISQVYLNTLILKLIEDGIISSDDCVVEYIPEFYHKDVKIIDVLTDSTGIDIKDKIDLLQVNGKKDYLDKLYGLLPTVSVSPKKHFNNFAFKYFVLIDLIERVTKTDVNEYANEILFKPLDISRTAFSVSNLKYNNSLDICDLNNNFVSEKETSPIIYENVYTTTAELLKVCGIFSSHNKKIMSKYTYNYSMNPMYFDADNEYLKTPVLKIKGDKDKYGIFGELSSSKTYGEVSSTGCVVSIDVENDIVIVITSNSCRLGADKIKFKRIINKIMSLFN